VTTPAAGWYPDPAGSSNARWWDGVTWTEHLQPAAAPASPAWGAQPAPAQPWGARSPQWGADGAYPGAGPQQPAPPATWLKRNALSLVTVVLALVILALFYYANIVLVAVLPAFTAASAVRRKEPLAVPAGVFAAAVVLFALTQFF
jgi:hypothetical protein